MTERCQRAAENDSFPSDPAVSIEDESLGVNMYCGSRCRNRCKTGSGLLAGVRCQPFDRLVWRLMQSERIQSSEGD